MGGLKICSWICSVCCQKWTIRTKGVSAVDCQVCLSLFDYYMLPLGIEGWARVAGGRGDVDGGAGLDCGSPCSARAS